jgi:hypothetical protein
VDDSTTLRQLGSLEFDPEKTLFISLTAFALGILLAGYVIATRCRRKLQAPGKSET